MPHGGCGQVVDVAGVVDADEDAGLPRKLRQPVDLQRIDDLVGDQHVADAACDDRLGFGDLLTAHADSAAEVHLDARDVGGLVGLGVCAMTHAHFPGEIAHPLHVALEGVEIDDQRRRLDVLQPHPDRRRDGQPDDLGSIPGHCVHGHVLLLIGPGFSRPPSTATGSDRRCRR